MTKSDQNDSDGMSELLNVLQDESAKCYNDEAEKFWDSMSVDDRLKAFYNVCKRIHDAEFKSKGSYRFVLYNVFGFDLDSYTIGIECGYMDIHNALVDATDKKLVKNQHSW
jgi:hypothetical protein